jgi:hypothetical protein
MRKLLWSYFCLLGSGKYNGKIAIRVSGRALGIVLGRQIIGIKKGFQEITWKPYIF